MDFLQSYETSTDQGTLLFLIILCSQVSVSLLRHSEVEVGSQAAVQVRTEVTGDTEALEEVVEGLDNRLGDNMVLLPGYMTGTFTIS